MGLLIRLFVSGLWCMCEFIRLTSQLWCLGLLDCAPLPRDSLKVEMEFWKRCATGNIEAVRTEPAHSYTEINNNKSNNNKDTNNKKIKNNKDNNNKTRTILR